MVLDRRDPERTVPHNPYINAGAIMACSLMQASKPVEQRIRHVMKQYWERLNGGKETYFDEVSHDWKRVTGKCASLVLSKSDPHNTHPTPRLHSYVPGHVSIRKRYSKPKPYARVHDGRGWCVPGRDQDRKRRKRACASLAALFSSRATVCQLNSGCLSTHGFHSCILLADGQLGVLLPVLQYHARCRLYVYYRR